MTIKFILISAIIKSYIILFNEKYTRTKVIIFQFLGSYYNSVRNFLKIANSSKRGRNLIEHFDKQNHI